MCGLCVRNHTQTHIHIHIHIHTRRVPHGLWRNVPRARPSVQHISHFTVHASDSQRMIQRSEQNSATLSMHAPSPACKNLPRKFGRRHPRRFQKRCPFYSRGGRGGGSCTVSSIGGGVCHLKHCCQRRCTRCAGFGQRLGKRSHEGAYNALAASLQVEPLCKKLEHTSRSQIGHINKRVRDLHHQPTCRSL